MRNFVQATAILVIIASSVAVLLNLLILFTGGGDKEQLIVIACAMFGYLVAGISYVLMDIAGALLQRLAPLTPTPPLG